MSPQAKSVAIHTATIRFTARFSPVCVRGRLDLAFGPVGLSLSGLGPAISMDAIALGASDTVSRVGQARRAPASYVVARTVRHRLSPMSSMMSVFIGAGISSGKRSSVRIEPAFSSRVNFRSEQQAASASMSSRS